MVEIVGVVGVEEEYAGYIGESSCIVVVVIRGFSGAAAAAAGGHEMLLLIFEEVRMDVRSGDCVV